MSNSELRKISQEELDKILTFHKIWLETKGSQGKRAKLVSHDLSGLICSYRFLRFVDFSNSKLNQTDFFSSDLADSDFQGSDLYRANFSNAALERVSFIKANLSEADFSGALIDNINVEGATLENVKNLPYIYQVEYRLAEKISAETNHTKREKIESVKEQLENIQIAISALDTSLINTDKQIDENQKQAIKCQRNAFDLIALDIMFVLIMVLVLLFVSGYGKLGALGGWSILLMTFPALLILLVAISLLRHQKQLIAEVRHYSMLKHKIELYCGILKAAQFMVASGQSAEYIQTVFDEIKTELLKSPNFDLNMQPHIFAEEGNQMMEMFKSSTDLAKAATEMSRNALDSVSKVGREK